MADQSDDADPYVFVNPPGFLNVWNALSTSNRSESATLILSGSRPTPPPTPTPIHTFSFNAQVPSQDSGVARGYVAGRGGTITDSAYTKAGVNLTINFIGVINVNTIRFGFSQRTAVAANFPQRIVLKRGDLEAEFENPSGFALRGLGAQMDYTLVSGGTAPTTIIAVNTDVNAGLY